MIINGVTIPDPDVGELDFNEKYEKAVEHIEEGMKEHDFDKLSVSEGIRIQCTYIFEFFDSVFGTGTAKTVFGERVNLKVCIDSYEQALTGINSLRVKLTSYFRNKNNGNRQQRRHKKTHHQSQKQHNR